MRASGAQLGGYVEVSGRVAYAPQQAWIMNATVKVRHRVRTPVRRRRSD